ncbi:MAG: SCO family protein [Rhodobacteraceae bacterium]|nr:SCO family protein [Paracoccaceae bacterium]
MSRTLAYIAVSVVVFGLGAAGAFVAFAPEQSCGRPAIAGNTAAIGGPFTLVDHTGTTVTDKDVIDGPTLVYFGFTYCPDVCPVDNVRNLEAADLLKDRGLDVTPVFISIDPERDTPEAMADFVEILGENMIGLTGSAEQVAAAAKAYRAYYRKNGTGTDYLVDHSTFTYLVNEAGFVEFFRRDASPEQVAERIACLVGKGPI